MCLGTVWSCAPYSWEYSRWLAKPVFLVNQPYGVGQRRGKTPLFLDACHLLQGHKASLILPWHGNTWSHCCKVWQHRVLTIRLCGRPGEREPVPGQPKGRCLILDPLVRAVSCGARHCTGACSLPWLIEEWWPWAGEQRLYCSSVLSSTTATT